MYKLINMGKIQFSEQHMTILKFYRFSFAQRRLSSCLIDLFFKLKSSYRPHLKENNLRSLRGNEKKRRISGMILRDGLIDIKLSMYSYLFN